MDRVQYRTRRENRCAPHSLSPVRETDDRLTGWCTKRMGDRSSRRSFSIQKEEKNIIHLPQKKMCVMVLSVSCAAVFVAGLQGDPQANADGKGGPGGPRTPKKENSQGRPFWPLKAINPIKGNAPSRSSPSVDPRAAGRPYPGPGFQSRIV